ncbi:hypothetical protein ABIB45_001339 [Arthrobacter sp. UYCo732]
MSRIMHVRAVVHHVHKHFTIFELPSSLGSYYWAYDNHDASLIVEGPYEFDVWRDAILASNRRRIERKNLKSGGSPALVDGAL